MVGIEGTNAGWGGVVHSSHSWPLLGPVGNTSGLSSSSSSGLPSYRQVSEVSLMQPGAAFHSGADFHVDPPALALYPSWLEVHEALYRLKGATSFECQHILNRFAKATIQRFSTAWSAFWLILHTAQGFPSSQWEFLDVSSFVLKLQQCPLWQIAIWVDMFWHNTSAAQARNLYASLLALPALEQLKFENSLKCAKRAWNSAKPKYDLYFGVETILHGFIKGASPEMEEEVRQRCIVLLRLVCLFRGIDLERSHRNIDCRQQPWMLESMRKGRSYWARYPIPCIWPREVNPQVWLDTYLEMTSDYQGSSLFVSLPSPQGRKPIKSDTINGITTRFMESVGITQWTAHATRGAGATALIARGVEPAIVQSLGDWQSTDCFNKFYNRVRATKPFQQCLIPDGLRGPDRAPYVPAEQGVLHQISAQLSAQTAKRVRRPSRPKAKLSKKPRANPARGVSLSRSSK